MSSYELPLNINNDDTVFTSTSQTCTPSIIVLSNDINEPVHADTTTIVDIDFDSNDSAG